MDESVMGEIRIFAADFAPEEWLYCNGNELPINKYQALFSILGTTYGGDGVKTFKLPFIPGGRTAIGPGENQGQTFRLGEIGGKKEIQLDVKNLAAHTHEASAGIEIPAYADSSELNEPDNKLVLAGGHSGVYGNSTDTNLKTFKSGLQVEASQGNFPIDIQQPSLCLGYAISILGEYPYDSNKRLIKSGMLGEIMMFAAKGESDSWLLCDGRFLDIAKYPDLFKVLGTRYGNNGTGTFAIPDFRGRVAMGSNESSDQKENLGKKEGSNTATMKLANLPQHTHSATATINIPASTEGNTDKPENAVLAGLVGLYSAEDADTKLAGIQAKGQLDPQGNGDPFSIMQPYCVINHFICVKGYYPS